MFGSIFDFFFSGLGVVLDIVVDGAREEARFLTDPYQIFSEMIEVVVFEFDSIQKNLSIVVVESLEELNEGGFTASRRSHKGYLLTFVDVKV